MGWRGAGLNEFEGQHPPVAPVFYAFRVMVGVGMLMLAVSWWGAWRLWRGRGMNRVLGWTLAGMTFSGWVATLAGWYVTEIGRQPWLVTGILRTGEAAGPIPAATIGMSLTMYLAVYAFLLLAYLGTLMHLAGRPEKTTPRRAGSRRPAASPPRADGSGGVTA
jgi:cytochrome d ubiquinol oxidase subunit I